MIDWLNVVISAIWILGLAVLLATVSIGYASATDKSLRSVLSALNFRLALSFGLILFSSGMALSVQVGWERIGWLLVVGLTVWDGIVAWRASRAK